MSDSDTKSMAGELHSRWSSAEGETLSILESFVPASAQKTPSTTAVSFNGFLDPSLLLHEDMKEGCGGQLWPVGIVLANYMLRHHQDGLAEKTMYV